MTCRSVADRPHPAWSGPKGVADAGSARDAAAAVAAQPSRGAIETYERLREQAAFNSRNANETADPGAAADPDGLRSHALPEPRPGICFDSKAIRSRVRRSRRPGKPGAILFTRARRFRWGVRHRAWWAFTDEEHAASAR